jgi:hypothetical protein
MRPRFTARSLLLLLIAFGVAGGLWYWLSLGKPLPGGERAVNTAGKLAFVRTEDANGGQQRRNIYLMNADGSGLAALTDGDGENRSPAWSVPRGARLAFVSNRGEGGGYQVFTLDPRPATSPSS